MLNNLDRKILSLILDRDAPVSGRELASVCGVSINTIRKEILLINEEMEPHGFFLEPRISTGIFLNIVKPELAEPYLRQLYQLCKRNGNLPQQYSHRVQYLVRECLCAAGYLTVESLCEKCFCSASTILRELEHVRRAIAPFGLKLVNRKSGQGLHVEGDEWNIRQCLIYCHKLWMLSVDKEDNKEYAFKTQFMMLDGIDWYGKIRTSLIELLKQQKDFTIPFMNIPKIIHYVELSATRRKYAPACQFSEMQKQRVSATAEYAFARQWMSLLPKRLQGTEEDIFGVAILLLSYETQNFHLDKLPEIKEIFAETHEMIDFLAAYWGNDYRKLFDAVFCRDWVCFLYTLRNRLEFKVYNDTEHLGFVRRKGIMSMDFCISFARFYKKKHGTVLSQEDTLSAFYLFNRALKGQKFNDFVPNIMVMSRYGLYYAESLAAKIKSTYEGEVGDVTAREFGAAKDKDFLTCDLLVTDLESRHLQLFPGYTLPVLEIDFSLGQTRYSELDFFLEKQMIEWEQKALRGEDVRFLNLHTKDEVLNYLGREQVIEGWTVGQTEEELRESDTLANGEREMGIVFLPLFSEKMQELRVRLLINRTPISWNESECQIFVCYSRTPSAKNNRILNEILRKFIYLPIDKLPQLLELRKDASTKELWALLAPDQGAV